MTLEEKELELLKSNFKNTFLNGTNEEHYVRWR